MSQASIFDNIIQLPDPSLKAKAERLIGFEKRFSRVFGNLKLLLDHESLQSWSKEHHKIELPILNSITDRYPLVILEGDAGTGKTVSAEAIADRMVRSLDKEGFFLKLSTRVRGEGLHGEMGKLVNDAFERLKTEAGKKRLAFLLIDEADAIATTRSTMQMHQEEKAAVNTLIQKIDEVRELKGRAIIFMSTNRLHFLDEAIVRRAALVMTFERPDFTERKELFQKELEGLGLNDYELNTLAEATGAEANDGLGFSFSDLRLKILPEAIAKAYPKEPLTFNILKETIQAIKPSPQIK
ncbi:MAG: ATP-binding protein [Bacteroidota bacterium]|nr:ATP-binding protein [Bacteroidota bacterium]